jgi:ribonucleotide reductase alpha subunit
MSKKIYTRQEVEEATLEYFKGDALATNVWVTKYALRDLDGNYLELTPEDMHRRLAREFARADRTLGHLKCLTEDVVFSYLKDFKYIVPQGSPMYGIGNDHQVVSLSNCVVIDSPEDNISSIMDAGRSIANLSKRRAGIGVDLSKLRPEFEKVSNSAGTTSGAWSFADFFSYVCRMIGQNGRRGALMISLDIKHPDIFSFVKMKLDKKLVTGANVSIKLRDDFMEALEKGEKYTLQWPVDDPNPKVKKEIDPEELWKLIIQCATDSAEPGVLLWDNITKYLPAHSYKEFECVSTNPCFDGNTLIAVADGRNAVSLRQLAEDGVDVPVYSVDPKSGKVSIKMGRNPRLTGRDRQMVRVHLDSGATIDVTPDHRFPLRDGREKIAKDLLPGDSLFNLSGVPVLEEEIFAPYLERASRRSNYEITAVRELDKHADVYTLTVDDNHTVAIATGAGVDEEGRPVLEGIFAFQCGEIPLSPNDSCRLISVNLKSFVVNPFTSQAYFDFDKFEEVVEVGAQLMDNLVFLEEEKLRHIIDTCDTEDERELWNKLLTACTRGRRTGLGTHGLADALARLRIAYDSDFALTVIDEIFEVFRNTAYQTSCDLAVIRGPFPAFDWEVEKDNLFIKSLPFDIQESIRKHGRRNIALLTNAPTGSVSICSQTSSGVEPVFRNAYTRRRKLSHNDVNVEADYVDELGDRWQEYTVYHHNALEYINETRDSQLPEYFVEADNIDWLKRIEVQAAMQRHIDHSISSTINLPAGTSYETVGELYKHAWRKGLKGVTVYVDGSRSGVLVTESEKKTEQAEATKDYVEALMELGCIREEAEMTAEGVIRKNVKLPEVFKNGDTKIVRREGNKYYINFSYLSEHVDHPIAFFVHSNNVQAGEYVTLNRGCRAIQRLLIDKGVDTDLVLDQVEKVRDNPHHTRLGKMISMALRHNIPVLAIVEALTGIEGDYISSTLTAIRKFLSEHIKDGTKSGKTCLACESTNVVFEGGCEICMDCGSSKCG